MTLNKENIEEICNLLSVEEIKNWSECQPEDFLLFKKSFLNNFNSISKKNQNFLIVILFLFKDFESLKLLPYDLVKDCLMSFEYSNRIFKHKSAKLSLNHKHHSSIDKFAFNFLKEEDKPTWLFKTFGVLKPNNLDFLKTYDHWWTYYNTNIPAKKLKNFFSSKDSFFISLNRYNSKEKSLKTKMILKAMILNVEEEFKSLIKNDIVAITNVISILPELFSEKDKVEYLSNYFLLIRHHIEVFNKSKNEYIKTFRIKNINNAKLMPTSQMFKKTIEFNKDLNYSLKNSIWLETLNELVRTQKNFLELNIHNSNRMLAVGFMKQSNDEKDLSVDLVNDLLIDLGFSRSLSLEEIDFKNIKDKREALLFKLRQDKEPDVKKWESILSSYGIKTIYKLIPMSTKVKLSNCFPNCFKSFKNIKESEVEFFALYMSLSDSKLSISEENLNILKMNYQM